jgi:hypothetical protein
MVAVAFEELSGISPRFRATETEVEATRVGIISWADKDNYYKELFPSAVNGIAQLPAAFPGRPRLYAESVTFEPLFDQDVMTEYGPPAGYNLCKVTVEYATKPYEQDDNESDQIITRRITLGGQFVTYPSTGFKFADTGKTFVHPDGYVTKFFGTVGHEITIHRAPTVPWYSIRGLVGKVNHAPWNGAAAETVLFGGCDVQQVYYADGSQPYQITFKFEERNIDGDPRIGWNHVYDPTATKGAVQGLWRPILQLNGEKLYKVGNFNMLW